jgi:hypothetical protein
MQERVAPVTVAVGMHAVLCLQTVDTGMPTPRADVRRSHSGLPPLQRSGLLCQKTGDFVAVVIWRTHGVNCHTVEMGTPELQTTAIQASIRQQ